MADYRVILFTVLAVAVFCISDIQARPHAAHGLFAEFENSFDATNKNEEMFNIPNDNAGKANDYDDKRNDESNEIEGCNTPTGGWFC